MTVFSHISTLKKDAFKNTANAFVPNSVLVPIKQDCENDCEWLVKAGDIVSEGQVIAASYGGDFKSSVYSPIPGVVKGLELCVCPDGRMCEAARINISGQFSFLIECADLYIRLRRHLHRFSPAADMYPQ